MSKKMNLEDTWKNCLAMWRWIAEQRRKRDKRGVFKLKEVWLEENGFKRIYENCFFCNYALFNCPACPGKQVSKRFDCQRKTYHFEYRPIAFYNKLVALNKKRKKKS